MKTNKIKFAGPSKKMADALEEAGLYVDWPKKIENESDLAIDGSFYTGCDWEKLVLIDLRDEGALSSKKKVDAAISNQLKGAYEAFDVDYEMQINMEGTKEERAARGVPNAERLLEDIKEQEEKLNRFALVADAVYNGYQIPPEEKDEDKEPTEEENSGIKLTAKQGRFLLNVLGCAIPAIKNIHGSLMDPDTENEVREIMNVIEEGLK